MNHKKISYLTQGGVIAALYFVLTMLAWGFNLASGAIQVRFSEMLCVMPFFTAAGVPGVTLGCFLANLVMGSPMPDVIFGTLATFIGAIGTRLLRRHRFLCTLPPVISNAIIIPLVLKYAYVGVDGSLPFLALTVGTGEFISCVLFGSILITALLPVRNHLFNIA